MLAYSDFSKCAIPDIHADTIFFKKLLGPFEHPCSLLTFHQLHRILELLLILFLIDVFLRILRLYHICVDVLLALRGSHARSLQI